MLKNVLKMIFESWKIFKNFEKKSENFRKFSKFSKKKWNFFRLFLSFKFRHPLFGVAQRYPKTFPRADLQYTR